MSDKQSFVIVGAGLAGAKAAQALREEGFEGRIALVGQEPERPYERPPLSKDFLRGESAERPFVHPESFYRDNDIDLLVSTRVTAIDPDGSNVVLADSRRIDYDRLLIATGAAPRALPVPGADLAGIHSLRTIADSERIRLLLERRPRLVVVGAGWIGGELAASARQMGCEVTIVELGSLPLERVLGPELGRFYLNLHRDQGVRFLAETGVERFEGAGAVERVVLDDGTVLDADLVVVGIGVKPRTELAEGTKIAADDGIAVDQRLETSVPGIFAAGDVARAHNPFYGASLRVEHWANALNQGAAAGRAMLGREVSYDEIPYFFSDQYETGMEYSGFAPDWDEVVFRGDAAGGEFVAFWLKDRRPVAGMNMNVWDVHDEIRALIRAGERLDPGRLQDPDVPLSSLVEGAEAALGARASA